MAKAEDLIAQVADPRLQQALLAEIKALKRVTTFGLVFEEHLPETLRLPGLRVQKGELVAPKRVGDKTLWRVRRVEKGHALCSPALEEGPSSEREERFPLAELVVVRRFGDPIYPALVPVDRVARGGKDKPWHILINADNFHALQLLLYTYERSVDVIYIDPPYNSGARDWKYNNDYIDRTDSFRHSKWLSMMNRRLRLAKRLLKPDGVLIVTIDENEVHHLGMLLQQIFDDYQRHAVTIVINPKGTRQTNFARTAEYAIFCIPTSETPLIRGNHIADLASAVDDTGAEDEEDSERDADPDPEPEAAGDEEQWDRPFPLEEADQWELRHARRRGNESSYRHQRPNQFYPIYVDATLRRVMEIGESQPLGIAPVFKKQNGLTPVWPIDKDGNERCWRYIPASMRQALEEGRLRLGKHDAARKTWTLNVWVPKNKNKAVKTVWWHTRHDAGTHGTTMLHQLLGKRDAFPFPKSLYAVRDTLLSVIGDRPDAVVLDFFAGSGTTAHAVALINAQLGGSRRTILVSNNEPGEKRARLLARAGHAPGDPAYEAEGICEGVTWPRCKNAINGSREDGTPLKGRYLELPSIAKELKLADGFQENLEYFRLDFIDPAAVARGDAFQSILPILWMMAGCQGQREDSKGSAAWFLPKTSPFAVLLRGRDFTAFQAKLESRHDVTTVFLVTDSEENFVAMRRTLGSRFRCVHLYKSYLETFRLNTTEAVR
jgi:adenine-specific DNA-methyltransferase